MRDEKISVVDRVRLSYFVRSASLILFLVENGLSGCEFNRFLAAISLSCLQGVVDFKGGQSA
jgi:hypothetical protein